MAPSSLKKTSGVQERKEGNYASLEKTPLGKFTNHDLGLTLLPGSQIRRKDEKRSGTAAESSPKQSGSKYARISEQWNFSESEIQSKYPAQETTFPTEAKSLSSSPDLGPNSAKISHVTSRIIRERLFSRNITAKNSNGVVHDNVKPLAAALYAEQTMVTGEVSNASSCQDDGCSPLTAKRRKLGGRVSHQIQDSNVSKETEAALEIHNIPSHMYHDQRLSEVDVVRSGKGMLSVETIKDPYSGTGGGLGSSKPKSRRQITHSPDTAPACSHQDTNVGSEVSALRDSSSVLATLASRSPAKDQNSEQERLHYQPSFSSKSFSTQHSRLFPDNSADIGTQVLKPRKEVNRSWAPLFPAKAKASKKFHRANRPAPSLLATSFTPSHDCQHPYSINTQVASTHLQPYTNISNAHPSPSLLTTFNHSKAFNHPFDYSSLENIFQTERATNQPHSVRRRSASLPNLSITIARPKMHFSNSMGPASMPTPPREKPSSLDQVDTSCNADISDPQNWLYNSNAQHHHRINLSDSQNTGFTSGLHPHQFLPQASNHQHMAGAPLAKAGALAAGGQQYSRPWLEVKANYSQEEVKFLVSNLVRQSKILKAENSNLQSVNAAMQKGCESLRHSHADLLQQIQRYERISTQKDELIAYMRQQGSSLHQQYKLNLEEHRRLLTRLRKEDGTGNPSAIAQKIRRNHSPSALSQGNQPSANAYPLHCANGAQISAPSHGFGQTPTDFQGHVQPTSAHFNQNNSRPTHQVPTDRVTIDLTDDFQSPSSSASWVHQTPQSSVQDACPPSNLPLGQYPQAQYPAGHFATSQYPPGLSAGGEDLEAMRIQKENFARMAGKPLSWLKGENPFRQGTGLPASGQPPQSNVEEHVFSAQSPEAGRVAPLPETATRQTTKEQAPKKTKVVLDDEAKKERAKMYRKTAAEKKKREKELAKQALPEEDTPSNDMRAQKQDRRAAKGEKRREQARKPSEEVGSWEPQKTLDGRLYQEDTGVQQAIHGGGMDQAASDDRDSLFDESEGDVANSVDDDIAMHDDATAEEQARAKLAAEIEADLEWEVDAEADVEAGRMTGFEQGDASGGQDYFPTAVANDDHGFHDFSDQGEESEEE